MKRILMTLAVATLVLTSVPKQSHAWEIAAGSTTGIIISFTLLVATLEEAMAHSEEAMAIQADTTAYYVSGELTQSLSSKIDEVLSLTNMSEEEVIKAFDTASQNFSI